MNKQETLEETIEILFRYYPESTGYRKAAIIGKEWQQERSYSEDEVRELLETQRGNCYVALLSHTKNDDISSIALQSPEPGGKNGTWVKSI
jgi:hypothetical protein